MDVIKAKKENKVYTITEQQKKRYLQEGFDIYDGEGNLLEHSPKKKIEYGKYDKVVKERDALLEAAGKADEPAVIEVLTDYAGQLGVDIGKTKTAAGIAKKIKEHALKAGE